MTPHDSYINHLAILTAFLVRLCRSSWRSLYATMTPILTVTFRIKADVLSKMTPQ
jgi:hypothetical protein